MAPPRELGDSSAPATLLGACGQPHATHGASPVLRLTAAPSDGMPALLGGPDQLISRATRNDIEKRSRHRRQQRMQEMHVRIQTLEMVLICLRAESSSSDESEDDHVIATMNEFLDPETHRLTRFLRESRALSQEMQQLVSQRDALLKVLLQKQEVEFSVRRALALRWAEWNYVDDQLRSAVAYAIYKPWRPEDVAAVIKETLQQINRFVMSTDRISTGREFMGWSDSRRLDTETSQLQFSFSKSFVNTNATRLFEEFWQMQFSAEKLRRYNLGYSTKLKLKILQRVSDDEVIVQREAQYPGLATKFHTVLLVFRRRFPNGCMAVMRTIPAPSIQRAIDGDAAWMIQFHWTRIEWVPDANGDLTGCRLSFCGSVSSENAQYARHWLMEIVTVLIRGENTMIAPRRICRN